MQVIQKNVATARYRRVFVLIYADAFGGTPWSGSVAGVKAKLSFNGQAEADSSADIVRVGGAVHYVELTQAESNTEVGFLSARVPSGSGRLEATGGAEIVNYDPDGAGLTAAQITADIDANSVAIASVQSDTNDIQSRLPAALVGGKIDANVGSVSNGAITAAGINTGAITAAKFAAGAIDAAAIADNAIDAAAIAANAITNAKVADGAISNAKLADGAISAAKIAADAISNAKLADGAISAAKFANDAITAAKVAADVTTEITNGLATTTNTDALSAKLDTLLARDSVYVKNVAVAAFPFPMELADGTPGTGLTVTAAISKDGGAFAAVAGAVSEISAGWYKVALAQAEMNADEVALKFTAAGAKQRNIKIRTQS